MVGNSLDKLSPLRSKRYSKGVRRRGTIVVLHIDTSSFLTLIVVRIRVNVTGCFSDSLIFRCSVYGSYKSVTPETGEKGLHNDTIRVRFEFHAFSVTRTFNGPIIKFGKRKSRSMKCFHSSFTQPQNVLFYTFGRLGQGYPVIKECK